VSFSHLINSWIRFKAWNARQNPAQLAHSYALVATWRIRLNDQPTFSEGMEAIPPVGVGRKVHGKWAKLPWSWNWKQFLKKKIIDHCEFDYFTSLVRSDTAYLYYWCKNAIGSHVSEARSFYVMGGNLSLFRAYPVCCPPLCSPLVNGITWQENASNV